MIHAARIHGLNDKPIRKGGFVLYWMEQSQRAEWNHALEYAVEQANGLKLPVGVVFGLTDNYSGANLRHHAFMLEGLQKTFQALEKRGIKAVLKHGHPADVALETGRDAALIVCDRGYLRHQREWRARVAGKATCKVVEVESDVVVPVETASDHAEYMAHTLRPKLHRYWAEFLRPVRRITPGRPWPDRRRLGTVGKKFMEFPDIRNSSRAVLQNLLKEFKLDRSVRPVCGFTGGTAEARKRLRRFIMGNLPFYDKNSGQPQEDGTSGLSPYLHFGQISPLFIALEVQRSGVLSEPKDRFLEQLLVRRELATNFVWFTPDYDQYSGLPAWAKQTLKKHTKDRREVLYTLEELEQSKTHDSYWNAAMDEMRVTGFMHGHMRMYWGKKVLEWSRTPEEVFCNLLTLNNKYFLDGRDPNSCAGVAWVFGKHDQAWKERKIFGKVRYMNADGLKRKCNIAAYTAKVRKRLEAVK